MVGLWAGPWEKSFVVHVLPVPRSVLLSYFISTSKRDPARKLPITFMCGVGNGFSTWDSTLYPAQLTTSGWPTLHVWLTQGKGGRQCDWFECGPQPRSVLHTSGVTSMYLEDWFLFFCGFCLCFGFATVMTTTSSSRM